MPQAVLQHFLRQPLALQTAPLALVCPQMGSRCKILYGVGPEPATIMAPVPSTLPVAVPLPPPACRASLLCPPT